MEFFVDLFVMYSMYRVYLCLCIQSKYVSLILVSKLRIPPNSKHDVTFASRNSTKFAPLVASIDAVGVLSKRIQIWDADEHVT